MTRHGRWGSPLFLAGESYGTVRAAGLADYLQRRFSLYLNGVVLISPALSQQTYIAGGLNDLPYILTVPGFTAWPRSTSRRRRGRGDISPFRGRKAANPEKAANSLPPIDDNASLHRGSTAFHRYNGALYQYNGAMYRYIGTLHRCNEAFPP